MPQNRNALARLFADERGLFGESQAMAFEVETSPEILRAKEALRMTDLETTDETERMIQPENLFFTISAGAMQQTPAAAQAPDLPLRP